MTKLILMAVITLLTGNFALASECRYTDRSSWGPVLSSLPPEVIGTVNCAPQIPDTNLLLTAKLQDLSKDSVRSFVISLARVIDAGAEAVNVEWESQTEPVQFIVRSSSARNSNGAIIEMSHYAFVSNQHVFFHSIDSSLMAKAKPALENIKHAVKKLSIPN